MSTNDASQTLFRMVSVRNPQLTETKEINFGFIQRPKGALGVFDKAVSDGKSQSSKLAVMLQAAPGLNTVGFRTESEIETGPYGTLLSIGRKISKRETLDDKDWRQSKTYYKGLVNPTNNEIKKVSVNDLTILWDNLIYQIITQKDFYVKEAISHVLKALHFGFAQTTEIDEDIIKVNGKNPLEKALDAKIVLPKELFMDNTSDVTAELSKDSDTLSPITVLRLTDEAQKNIMVNEALYKKESLLKLSVELKQLEKSYYKQRNKVYNEVYSIYQKEMQPKIDELERKLNEIEGSIGENNEISKSTLINETVKALEIPPFEFDYKSEINADDLKSNLSPASLHLFLDLFGKKSQNTDIISKTVIDSSLSENRLILEEEAFQLDEYIETYNEAISEINNQISTQYEAVLQNTELVQQQYINIGGATIPIAQNTSKTHLAYLLAVQFAKINPTLFPDDSSVYVYFGFEVQDSSWNILYAKVIADTNNGYLEENYSNIAVINNTVTLPQILGDRFLTINSIRIEIYFGNGKEAFMELSPVPNGVKLTGLLTLKNVLPEETEKRKNFGIKRIGVADYLKVVQSVHAYVPGLVSNIENVMASELRHKSSVSRDYSEITDTTSKYQETEKISDTSKTSRTDMQSEVAREIDKQQAITAHTRFNYDTKVYKFEMGSEYANNTAQHDSNRQAVMKSQELTEKAMERVLTKISEERVQKIIKEYTETNVHEFDNRGKVTETNNPEAAQPKHITGVYRWIDIKYKNQIYNYGIRTMFEFMVPEPARLHRLALAVAKGQILTAPIDPRKVEGVKQMLNSKVASKALIEEWAKYYNVELTPIKLSDEQKVSTYHNFDYRGNLPIVSTSFTINSGYICKAIKIECNFWKKATGGTRITVDLNGLIGTHWPSSMNYDLFYFGGLNLSNSFPFSHSGANIGEITHSLTLTLELTTEELEKWKAVNFDSIIKAYDAAYKTFQEEQAKLDAEQKATEAKEKVKLGQFYRYMEHDVLKHNCIAYLLQDYLSIKSVGQKYTEGNIMENFAVNLGDNLDQYTALAKFMEQAFEWEIMDYTFYPYYWANRDKWQEMYISDSVDPLFRSFLQSGMARIIVTVRPGFENAVQFFLETGLIWNGGEVPVIGDPMYMSIVDEMRKTLGTPQGKYWITKLPTTLTILQDKSTGLPVDQPLPVFPESDPSNCENPSELVDKSSFESRDISLGIKLGEPSTLPKD